MIVNSCICVLSRFNRMVTNLTHSRRDSLEKLAIIILGLSICSVCGGSRCDGLFKGCCHGFYWNSTTLQCEQCMPGYTGENCSSPCPYPYYGVACQRTCNCTRDMCDISTGCNCLTTEKEMTAAQPTSPVEKNTSIAGVNNTVSTDNYDTSNKGQEPRTANKEILLCIQILGCVDLVLICIYSAVCIFDRQHRTLGKVNTNENGPGNNLRYENAEIFFLSATGN